MNPVYNPNRQNGIHHNVIYHINKDAVVTLTSL